MILKCTSFEGMQREIVGRDMSIVVFGAGVIGTVTVPEILRRYDLLGRVAFLCGQRSKHTGPQDYLTGPQRGCQTGQGP